jgi:hypothetical protein
MSILTSLSGQSLWRKMLTQDDSVAGSSKVRHSHLALASVVPCVDETASANSQSRFDFDSISTGLSKRR